MKLHTKTPHETRMCPIDLHDSYNTIAVHDPGVIVEIFVHKDMWFTAAVGLAYLSVVGLSVSVEIILCCGFDRGDWSLSYI